jgi:ABC-2 type transport system ATP-binding protein
VPAVTVLELAGLRKEYRTFRAEPTLAVDGLDLVIEHPGTVVGFLGPNGSGKTTTIRCMLGLIRPTAGSVSLLGQSMPSGAAAAIRRVGALVEQPKFFGDFSGRRNLRLLARIGGIPGSDLDRVLELVGLTDAAGMKFRKYSLGMKQRLAVAATLLKDPDLLVLDEPTNGLDPAGIVEMRHVLRDLGDSGKTVFVSSHQLGEIEQVCDRIVIIDHGKVVVSGSVDDVMASASQDRAVVQVDRVDSALAVLLAAGFEATVGSRPGTVVVESPPDDVSSITRALANQGIYLQGLRIEGQNLEEVFLTLTEGESGA